MRNILILCTFLSLNLAAIAKPETPKSDHPREQSPETEKEWGITDYLYSWYGAAAGGLGSIGIGSIPVTTAVKTAARATGAHCGCGGTGNCATAQTTRYITQSVFAFALGSVTAWMAARGLYKPTEKEHAL